MHFMKRSVTIFTALLLPCCQALAAETSGVLPATQPSLASQADAHKLESPAVHPFPLTKVRLLEGSQIYQAQQLDHRYLLSLDPDRLLSNFRVTAFHPESSEPGSQPLRSWEAPDCWFRGHFVGHYLSACALMYASTGDEKLKANADYVVAELAKCQKALGSGYLSAFPSSLFDRIESGQRAGDPHYCIHKIMAGLLDMYRLADNRQALEVLKSLGAYFAERNAKLSDETMDRIMSGSAPCDMGNPLYDLYGLTGEQKYKQAADRLLHARVLDPPAARQDKLKGLHANATIPKFLLAAHNYELTGSQRHREAAEYFWEQVVNHRSYCTGGTSNRERWRTEPDRLATELGELTQETCCAYNMLKLTRQLFTWNPSVKYADYYERTLWNAILPTQHPRDGMFMYYVPLESGWWKMFSLPEESFWCCVGTGTESFAKLADSIYFHDASRLYINLFIPSQLDWSEKGVRIRQETGFPDEEATRLRIEADRPVEFELKLRIPGWTGGGAVARLNGQPLPKPQPGSYLTLARTWKDGDCLELTLPMSLRMEPLPGDSATAAICYGPLVLAGGLGVEGLTEAMQHTSSYLPSGRPVAVPALIAAGDPVETLIKPLPGKRLTFQVEAEDRQLLLSPFYRLFDQRYAVYWHIYRPGTPAYNQYIAAKAQQKALAARRVDAVLPGDAASEKAHDFKGEKTRNGFQEGRPWRDATNGGWFSYRMKVLPNDPVSLLATYWGSNRGRVFDFLVDGQKIATQIENAEHPGECFDVEYNIPKELTRGKQSVAVKLQSRPDNAGGVLGFVILKREKEP